MRRMMVDIETLDTIPSAAILSIAAVVWDSNKEEDAQMMHYNIHHELNVNRTKSPQTINWWTGVPEEALIGATNPLPKLEDLDCIVKFFKEYIPICKEFWCKGTNFDFPILESFFRDHNIDITFPYSRLRDLRTVEAMLKPTVYRTNNHHALADCVNQIMTLQSVIH